MLKIFLAAEGTKPWVVLLCLVLGGMAEAIGIGSLLPIASSLLNEGPSQSSGFNSLIANTLKALGMNNSFGNLVLLLVLIMVIRSLLLFVAMTYAGISGARVTINLRRKLIKAVFAARWSFYASQSGGRLATAISNDATRAGDAYNMSATAVAMSIQIMAYAAIALFINWHVAIAGIAGGSLIALVTARLVGLSKRAGYKQTDRVAALTTNMVDMLQNIKALKSMKRYDAMIDNLAVLLRKLKRALYTQSIAKYGLTYGNDILVAMLVGLGAYLAHVYGRISLPELMVFGLLFFQVISYVSKLLKQVQMAAQVESAHVRLTELINLAEVQREPETGGKLPSIGKGCKFENVSFSHANRPTVRSINLEIPVNRVTVLQGPSGAGKTTLIDLLIGFHRPDKGAISIGKDNLTDIDMAAWRRMIGYVPQELALFHDSIRNNITLHENQIPETDLARALALSGVNDFLDQLPDGLETDVGEFGGKLSGGQRQRIALARALVKNPKVLILDEVTSALDPETEAAIVANIAKLRGAFTIVAITHRPAWTTIADQLYHLSNGKAAQRKPVKRKPKS